MNTESAKPLVLITGGSKGIGYATAQVLLERGCRIALFARDAAGLATALGQLVAAGHAAADIIVEPLDLHDTAALAARVTGFAWLPDRVAGLVNNAAVERIKHVTEYTHDDLEAHWRVNMMAPVLLIQALHSRLKAAKGSVVNVSSIADAGWHARYSVYGASKAFLHSFTRHAARELGYDGIRINLVTPGGTNTPLMEEIGKQFSEEHKRARLAGIPMEQRWADAREVAETIHFALFGPRYLHGADLRIDGGI
jgi:NAD(P)-dependent dehydrogenase (short-subunit alcohol dehydrogenase family)